MLLRRLILQRSAIKPISGLKLSRQTKKTNKNAPDARKILAKGNPQGETSHPGALTGNSDPQCQRPNHKKNRSTPHQPGPAVMPASWWRRSDSNRRPEACKAPALPTELRPQENQARKKPKAPRVPIWWAREDSNFRPHAYQARALTN